MATRAKQAEMDAGTMAGTAPPACDLIARVGERVRKARKRKGIPRRVLSEISGVSPRYLAQLESGVGNISIGLLERVAHALDHDVEWFVGEEDPWTSDTIRMAALFREAAPEIRETVMRILGAASGETRRARRICLLGLRGAGKSTLGRRAGEALGIPFVELNQEIEKQGGIPVAEIISLYGLDGYRRLESQALRHVVAEHDSLILAAAGGIVSEPKTFDSLLCDFHSIWLKAEPEDHMRRVRAQGDIRPMTDNPAAMEQLELILRDRSAEYGRAEARLDTSGRTVEESLYELLSLISEHGFLSREPAGTSG